MIFICLKGCIESFENNCPCNTPFLQLTIMQQNVALQVARKVELSSTFRNVARQVAACNMSSATCNVFHSPSLRCKLQEKLPHVTWPYVIWFNSNCTIPPGHSPADLTFFRFLAVYSPPPGSQKETIPHPWDSQ